MRLDHRHLAGKHPNDSGASSLSDGRTLLPDLAAMNQWLSGHLVCVGLITVLTVTHSRKLNGVF